MDDIEQRRKKALDKVDKQYYDRTSPHYLDNERYSWAINIINKKYDEEIEELKSVGNFKN